MLWMFLHWFIRICWSQTLFCIRNCNCYLQFYLLQFGFQVHLVYLLACFFGKVAAMANKQLSQTFICSIEVELVTNATWGFIYFFSFESTTTGTASEVLSPSSVSSFCISCMFKPMLNGMNQIPVSPPLHLGSSQMQIILFVKQKLLNVLISSMSVVRTACFMYAFHIFFEFCLSFDWQFELFLAFSDWVCSDAPLVLYASTWLCPLVSILSQQNVNFKNLFQGYVYLKL